MTLRISFFPAAAAALRCALPTRFRASLIAVLCLAVAGPALAAGPLEKAKDAVDPDCTVGKAAKGAATKAVVGVRGNRCASTFLDPFLLDMRIIYRLKAKDT